MVCPQGRIKKENLYFFPFLEAFIFKRELADGVMRRSRIIKQILQRIATNLHPVGKWDVSLSNDRHFPNRK